jgi:hypothetical protein
MLLLLLLLLPPGNSSTDVLFCWAVHYRYLATAAVLTLQFSSTHHTASPRSPAQ